MKSIFRRLTTTGLVVGALIGSLIAGATQVLAIPEDQIVKILDQVPIFFIGNSKGILLTSDQSANQKNQKVALAFVSPKDAQAYLDQVKKANPNVGGEGQILVQPLSAIYLHNKESKDKKDGFVFECCIPTKQNVDAAVTLLQQSGQKPESLRSTPLFVARYKDKKGYLVARNGDKIVDWPIFFSKEDLLTALEPLKKQDPKLSSNIEVEVIDLASLMTTLSSKNDASFSAVRLVPSRESIEFLAKQLPPQQPGANQAAPKPAQPSQSAPKPAPKK